MYGKIRNIRHELQEKGKSSCNLTMHIAEASDEGNNFTISHVLGGGIMITHKETGNDWKIGLRELVNLAISEGILTPFHRQVGTRRVRVEEED